MTSANFPGPWYLIFYSPLGANLDVAFDDSGRQINPLTGNVAEVMKLFNRCGWLAGWLAGWQSLSLVPPCPTSIR
ncbi:TPA: hypothetical protein MD887_004455 [Klebsiella oxytoca]|nr:hypothetical protein [Klebsiella oxytoca]